MGIGESPPPRPAPAPHSIQLHDGTILKIERDSGLVSDSAEGEIEAAWAHARLCESLDELPQMLAKRKETRKENWKRGLTHLMGANTTTPDQLASGRKVSSNYDDGTMMVH